ncbi:unnamed protein product [Urochloa humidicola]
MDGRGGDFYGFDGYGSGERGDGSGFGDRGGYDDGSGYGSGDRGDGTGFGDLGGYGDGSGSGSGTNTADFLSQSTRFHAGPYAFHASSSRNPSPLGTGSVDLNPSLAWPPMGGYQQLLASGGEEGSAPPPPVRVPQRQVSRTLGFGSPPDVEAEGGGRGRHHLTRPPRRSGAGSSGGSRRRGVRPAAAAQPVAADNFGNVADDVE